MSRKYFFLQQFSQWSKKANPFIGIDVWCVRGMWWAWQMINIACLAIFFIWSIMRAHMQSQWTPLCLSVWKNSQEKNLTMNIKLSVWMCRTSMNFRRLRVNMNYSNFKVFTWLFVRRHRSAHFFLSQPLPLDISWYEY